MASRKWRGLGVMEVLYRKSWQPLTEADKSAPQVICGRFMGDVVALRAVIWSGGMWCYAESMRPVERPMVQEFLHLEPVDADQFPKVI